MPIGSRAVQGVAAALLLPCTLAVIAHAFPGRAEQARAIGVWAGVSALALPAGPPLGGALVFGFGWRTIFLINFPLIVLALHVLFRLVRGSAGSHPRRLDLSASALATVALAATVYAVIQTGNHGLSTRVWAILVVALLAGAGFLARQRWAADPLLPLARLRNSTFTGTNTVAAVMNAAGMGTIFIATLYLQTVQHRSALLGGALQCHCSCQWPCSLQSPAGSPPAMVPEHQSAQEYWPAASARPCCADSPPLPAPCDSCPCCSEQGSGWDW